MLHHIHLKLKTTLIQEQNELGAMQGPTSNNLHQTFILAWKNAPDCHFLRVNYFQTLSHGLKGHVNYFTQG